MLAELAELLEKTGKIDEIAIGQYSLKSGLYIKLNKNGEIIEHCIINKNTAINSSFDWFKKRDYYSKLIEMNKSVDKNKKIHSNNIYTMFIKCASLPQVGDSSALSKEKLFSVLDDYYNKLNSEGDSKEKTLLEFANIDSIDITESNSCKEIFKNSIDKIIELIKEIGNKEGFSAKTDYVKIFIKSDENDNVDLENYIREHKRYFVPKIYNNNNSNIVNENVVYGLSNENMGLNSKKPYLELKSTKFKVPYRVPLNQAMTNRKVIEWVENAKIESEKDGKTVIKNINLFNIEYDFNFEVKPEFSKSDMGICFETMPTKTGVVVTDSNSIPKKIDKLNEYFVYKNYINVKDDTVSSTKNRYSLEKYIDEVFFKNQMKIFYYNKDFKPKGLSTYYVNAMHILKEPMKNYFRLGVDNSLDNIIDNITFGLVLDSIHNGDDSRNNIKKKLNLRLNLLKYFKIGGKEKMGDKLTEIREKVKSKIMQDEYKPIESDEEFSFCVGQLTYYLCSLSEASYENKNQDEYNEILVANNKEKIIQALINIMVKYNYKIRQKSDRFNQLFNAVGGYENDKICKDMLICGLYDNNLIYTKEENKDEI